MTTARKALLIIATVLLIGGCALASAAFAMADFKLENLSNTSRSWTSTTNTFAPEADGAHASIVIQDDSENVRIEPTVGDSIEITYWTSATKDMQATDKNGIITLTGTLKPTIMLMHFGFSDYTTVVKIPASYTGSITLKTLSGNIEAEGLSNLNEFNATLGSGRISVEQVSAASINLDSMSGTVDAKTLVTNDALLSSTSGRIALSDASIVQNLHITNMSGQVHLQNVHAANLDASNTSGNIEAYELDTSDLKLEAVSGSVNAILLGSSQDYSITASSVSGHIDTPQETYKGSKQIFAKTMSGRISLSFTDDTNASNDSDRKSGTPAAPAAPAAPAIP